MEQLFEKREEMIVRIGVAESARELAVELSEDIDGDAVRKKLEDTLKAGDSVFWLTDRRGRQIGVPIARIAYLEIGGEQPPIGFG